MQEGVLDQVMAELTELVEDRSVFEERYGKQAGLFLEHLPALFRLFHRLTFEFDLTTPQRQLASSVAVYIAEHNDFFREAVRGVLGTIDDLWIACHALGLLHDRVPEEVLSRHWLSETPFEEITGLAHNANLLDPHLPPRVLSLARAFLGLEEADVDS
jgi:uncharacterized membrane protein YkvA (DUF1232 family)